MNIGCNIKTAAILHTMASPFYTEAKDEKFANVGFINNLNNSLLNLINAENEAGKLGNHIRKVSQLNNADQFALQGEALYSGKSLNIEYDNVTFDGEANLRINHSDVPLLLIFKPNENLNLQTNPENNQSMGEIRYIVGLQKIEEDNEINGIT